MASTYSSNIRLELMGNGENAETWGTKNNTNLQLLEASVAGRAAVTHDDAANYTLTANNGSADESRQMILNIAGALTAARNTVCPTQSKLYVAKNATSGGFATTLKTSAGTGISIPNGKTTLLMCDGTNVVTALDYLPGGLTLGGAISAYSFIPTDSAVPTNGMYLISANNIGLATNSTLAMDITALRLRLTGDLIVPVASRLYLDSGVDSYIVQAVGGIISVVCDGSTELSLSSSTGASRIVNGLRIGVDSSNNLLDDSSNGAATATLYIGNAAIQVSSGLELKENIVDTKRDGLAITDALRVVDFTWNDPSDTAPNNRNSRGVWTGLIAQEAVEHVPWLVNAPDPKCPTCLAGEKCAKHPSHWFMDLAYMAPLLVRAIQQLKERVVALETM